MAFINHIAKNLFTVNAVGCNPVRLYPGINEVSQTQLECMQKHPIFNALVKAEKIVVMEIKKSPDGKISVKEMIGNIKKMYDPQLLKKIIKEDGREDVIEAAREQLDLVKPSKKIDPTAKEEEGEQQQHFR